MDTFKSRATEKENDARRCPKSLYGCDSSLSTRVMTSRSFLCSLVLVKKLDWKKLLASTAGSVDAELLLRLPPFQIAVRTRQRTRSPAEPPSVLEPSNARACDQDH